MQQLPLTITNAALNQLRLQARTWVRLGVKASGCEGFEYAIRFDTLPKTNDHIYDLDENLHLLIDEKSFPYLSNSILDWEKTLMHIGFKWINNKEISRCGCGNSISFGEK